MCLSMCVSECVHVWSVCVCVPVPVPVPVPVSVPLSASASAFCLRLGLCLCRRCQETLKQANRTPKPKAYPPELKHSVG